MNVFVIEAIRNRLAAVKGFFAVASGVNNLVVFGDGQAAHGLFLFGEPVEEQVEFGFVQRLGKACGEQEECQ